MTTMASIINTGGKKYLPETDYLGQIKLSKIGRNAKQQLRLQFSVVICDTLPEGGFDDLADSLKDNEKFPGDERLFDMLTFADDSMKQTAFDFHSEKMTEFMVGCGILAIDEEGVLSLLDTDIDLNSEPSADWFLDRYIGIKVAKRHHWSDRDKVKPKQDTIVAFLPVPEVAE